MKTIVIFNEDIKMDISDDTEVYHYVIDKDVKVDIRLNKEDIEVKYNLSVINLGHHECAIKVMHEVGNNKSDIVCHGVNVYDKELVFDINGIVPSTSFKAECNEENRIINLREGKSVIKPNLLVRNFDTFSTHSAYIGPFNKDIIFYLSSKGLSVDKIKELLLMGLLVRDGCPQEFIDKLKEIANG